MMGEIAQKDLGDGLLLRRARPEDAQRVAEFNASIHSDEGPDQPDARIAAWTLDLFAGTHPTFHPEDFTVVEDTHSGRIVSSLNLISQTWTYAGIPFGVGRPELVGTLPEYRRRGLVREQFEVIHQWSAQRGELAQAITGIPNYYRQFGYEMCVNLSGSHTGYLPNLPVLAEGEEEPYRFRPASLADIPFLQETYVYNCRNSLLSAVWTDELWRHELTEKRQDNVNRVDVVIIEDRENRPVGYLCVLPYLAGPTQGANRFDLKAGASYWAVTPSALRYIWQAGQVNAQRDGKECSAYGLWLSSEHPAIRVAASSLPRERRAYAFYMRVADVPAFIRRITPALEQRLEQSACCGYSGEIKVSFYRGGGIQLTFEAGKLLSCVDWAETPEDKPHICFPAQTFLHLLFGYRTIAEIQHMYVDCYVREESIRPVMDALFPRQNSEVMAIS